MPSPTPVGSAAYRSPYGPKYHFQPHFAGVTRQSLFRFGFNAGAFGGVALFTVIYYASGIPRVQDDILKKFPGLASYYDRQIPASDSPF